VFLLNAETQFLSERKLEFPNLRKAKNIKTVADYLQKNERKRDFCKASQLHN